ncbi:hypothetical protein MPDQ_000152 [Monascus purpureus]|uniref:Uncharacterized protein n=1 Tax=Monascus purpureus TaxID=5098 RepID=A0A507R720_MONPU|nr:hypothetical protein MPDQ_000152 [Monascus purpureus]
MTDEETISSPSRNAIGGREGLELSNASQEARGCAYPLLTVEEIRERLEEMREKRRKEHEEQGEQGELGELGELGAPREDSDRRHKEWRETFDKTARELRSFRLSLRHGVLESRRAANVKRNDAPLPHDENKTPMPARN